MHLFQRTVAKPVRFSGIGVHSGQTVNLTINPAPTNHGIKFVRTDLPDQPSVSAHFNMVVDTSLATVIGNDGFIVSTIEHLMACLAGLAIDNALIEMDGYEVPIMDGSAGPFAELVVASGVKTQDAPRCFFVVNEPIEYREKDRSICIYPADTFKISYRIEFDHPLLKEQTYSLDITDESFTREIARARTFGFLQEVEYLQRYGFAKGGSLDNVIVIDRDGILNEEGLRFPDEFVRHKILDCVGDFSLLGMPLLGHVVANKAGHKFNHAFLEKFFAHKGCWQTCNHPDIIQHPAIEAKTLAI